MWATSWRRGYGNLIMIKHSEDYITAYAHNDTMLVNNGQSVKAGQKIALTMGSTDAASVRLHFQIRYRATAIDRYLPVLAAAGQQAKMLTAINQQSAARHLLRRA